MKRIILLSFLALGVLGLKPAAAQVRVGVSINLGGPVYTPAPAPVEQVVYDDDYYYLPEVEAYYSVPQHCYFYFDGYSWVSGAYLPGNYRDFDWRTARRYAVHANRPYLRHDTYRGKFGGYANRDNYYARAFPGRDWRSGRPDGRPQRYDNRGWDRPQGNPRGALIGTGRAVTVKEAEVVLINQGDNKAARLDKTVDRVTGDKDRIAAVVTGVNPQVVIVAETGIEAAMMDATVADLTEGIGLPATDREEVNTIKPYI